MTTAFGPTDWVMPPARTDLERRFRAMATDVHLRMIDPDAGARAALDRAAAVFRDVERACTRFDPSSPLMRANAAPDEWHLVPGELLLAIDEAARAYEETDGRFDPRVLDDLVALGYDATLPFADGDVTTGARARVVRDQRDGWSPGVDRRTSAVRIGPRPIDLGGIGKGLAVRLAAAELAAHSEASLVEAGGDCRLNGDGPDGAGWSVGVEDAAGGDTPVAVLTLSDLAVATSSTRMRRWRSGGTEVHHLIDPSTGLPGGDKLRAVTVVDVDPANAEVWAKALFLGGAASITGVTAARAIAALWQTDDGTLAFSDAARPFITWVQS